MKIFSWVKTLPVIYFLAIVSGTLNSQVPVERSKEKVIISGIPYYIHHVKKGETAYSISRAYGISGEVLFRENPPAVYGVNEGQSLRIPINQVTEVIPSQTLQVTTKHDEEKYIYHKLKPGETVFFLSKSYGVSENEIIQSNPSIDIIKLPVGAEIAVPRRVFKNDQQKFDEQEKKYIFHKVLKGESLASIAKLYGISVRELRRENRDLRFPQVDDFVRIPGQKMAEVPKNEPLLADTISTIVEKSEIIVPDRPTGFTQLKDLRGSLNVAVLLPFYQKENAVRIEIDSSKFRNGKKVYKPNKMPEDWIYPGSLDFVEMYLGILLAVDTLRTLGLNVTLHTFDIKNDTVEITKLINSGVLAQMNLIIGPVYSHNLNKVAEYVRALGIPVISPVTLFWLKIQHCLWPIPLFKLHRMHFLRRLVSITIIILFIFTLIQQKRIQM
jgi:LysM repeat protein